MFTVKHIDHSVTPPVENLYHGERVTFHPDAGNQGALEIRNGDAFIAGLWGGMAYVMNDHGKTVARYDLPPAPALGRSEHAPECAFALDTGASDRCMCGASEAWDRKTASSRGADLVE